jgi:ribonuclease P protein component
MILSQSIRDLPRHEKNLSTQQFEAQAYARLSRAHEYQERPGRHKRTSCEGPRAAGGLNPHPLRCSLARFPRQARLTRPAEYRRVFDHSQCKASNRWMTVLATPNACHVPRLGLVISRKAAGCAVKRNRIKRLVRESFRQRQPALGSLDIVFIGRAGISERPNSELAQSLEKIWKRLMETCVRC